MEKIGLNQLREMFLSFFESKGHLRLPSFSLLPETDKSLLLINSGMAPLKPFFSGEQTPPRSRVTTCQKCIRTPDIERVGKTSRHGTFFEMLGNFSFGDYFKRDATAWAWEFCTEVLKLPKERLYVSVYQDDDEAMDIWTREVGVDPSHMVRLGKEDNFWEIGSGPCGPCSEIYFDRGEEHGCGKPDCKVGCDCDRFVEFWNLVFTQFNNDGAGNYTPLQKKNIDTGMGLERLACIMQGVDNIFEVDTIKNIMLHVSDIAGVAYNQDPKRDVSLRVITDHIRSTTMLVCDGILPSNEGRGYVLRRLLRRAARHGKLLGIQEPFLYKVCDTVIRESGEAYPQLLEKQGYIRKVIRIEEERFQQTIDGGMKLLNDYIQRTKDAGGDTLSGEDAFRLYDTYGFPIDLTLEICEEQGLKIDEAAFQEEMNRQKERARTARAALGDFAWANVDWRGTGVGETLFTGYDSFREEAQVQALVYGGALQQSAEEGRDVVVVLDRTPFYAEMGGQVADTGVLEGDGCRLKVTQVEKTGDGKFLHTCTVELGAVQVGDTVTAQIDEDRRRAIMRAHSATHLLQKALQNVLGSHVEQAGSLVEPDRLRFDFTHFSSISSEELMAVERQVNNKILEGLPVVVREMPIDEAKKLGAMALFGEKYGDVVRVVSMGDYSVELCGGTHLNNTAMVGPFAIGSESSIASGVRRIEAHVGRAVLEEVERRRALVGHVAEIMKTTPQELEKRAAGMMAEVKNVRRELERLRSEFLKGEIDRLMVSHKEVSGLHVLTYTRDDLEGDALRQMCDQLKDRFPKIVAVLASTQGGKITFAAVCGKEAVKRGVKAGEIIKQMSRITGGGGGGRPDSAMGGGKDLMKLDDALATLDEFVAGNAKTL